MNDPELFELCKEVYERTGLDSKTLLSFTRPKGKAICPKYTSDFLLDVLPKTLWSTYGLVISAGEYISTAGYYDADGLVAIEVNELVKSKDVRIALLKLTITLHDTGELK